jgi:hypothetical protein
MGQNRILNPVQIARIVHMPHEIDVSRQHAYAVKGGEGCCHQAFIINDKKRSYSLITAKT